MERDEMLTRVSQLLRDIFDDTNLDISEGDSQETIEDWDSLAHINIVSALEDEFNVSFDIADIPNTRTVKGILDVLENKQVE